MKKNKFLCFDMDGTIADLYNVKNWLPMIRAEKTTPYEQANPMCDMIELTSLLTVAKSKGWKIMVISWSAKDATKTYTKRIAKAKKDWLKKYNFPADKVYILKYGEKKHSLLEKIESLSATLIDDDVNVRKEWTLGETVNPQEIKIVEYLRKQLTSF